MNDIQKMELIQSYIDEIKNLEGNPQLSVNERQHVKRAMLTYSELMEDARKGKLDLDELHENISSYMYYTQ